MAAGVHLPSPPVGLVPLWRHNWRALSITRRTLIGLLLAASMTGAIVLASGLLADGPAKNFSAVIFAWLPLGAGVLLLLGSTRLTGQARWAWTTIGAAPCAGQQAS